MYRVNSYNRNTINVVDAQLEEDISNTVVNYLNCVGPAVEDLTRFGIASESGYV